MNPAKKLAIAAAATATALAILDQLVRDPEYRTWYGDVFGVPYDFRPPTLDRVQRAVWSPDDPRLLTPHVFGVGWTLNAGRLYSLLADRIPVR